MKLTRVSSATAHADGVLRGDMALLKPSNWPLLAMNTRLLALHQRLTHEWVANVDHHMAQLPRTAAATASLWGRDFAARADPNPRKSTGAFVQNAQRCAIR